MQPERSLPSSAEQVQGFLSRTEAEPEGFRLDEMAVGAVLEVETRHHVYHIKNLGHGQALILGHPDYCPEPVPVDIIGSAWGDGIPRLNFFGQGARLEFYHPVRGFIRTSRIINVRPLFAAV